MTNDSEEVRIKQAEFLTRAFEQANGRAPADTEDIDRWMKSLSDEEKQIIKMRMELSLKTGGAL